MYKYEETYMHSQSHISGRDAAEALADEFEQEFFMGVPEEERDFWQITKTVTGNPTSGKFRASFTAVYKRDEVA